MPGQFRISLPLRSRLTAVAVALAVITSAILLRFLPPESSTFYPACPIHRYFGVWCPGCGATRALSALLHGHAVEAWRMNALVLLLLPFALAYSGEFLMRLWQNRPNPLARLPHAAICALLTIAAAFALARNLPL